MVHFVIQITDTRAQRAEKFREVCSVYRGRIGVVGIWAWRQGWRPTHLADSGTVLEGSLDLRGYMYPSGPEFLCEHKARPQSISVIPLDSTQSFKGPTANEDV